jgi:two-component system, NarL family, nitrate/nitrite response regulator NarL
MIPGDNQLTFPQNRNVGMHNLAASIEVQPLEKNDSGAKNFMGPEHMAYVTSFPQQQRIRVLTVDNTSMNTQLLVETLSRNGQFHMSAPGSRQSEVLAAVRAETPDVALISARQGNEGTAGFGLCREICAIAPETRVIMLLDSSERTFVVGAFRSGARGVFSRTEPLNLLAKCIACVHQGQVWARSEELCYVLEAVAEPMPLRIQTQAGKALLSAREFDVVRCVAEGLTNREIANRLGLTEHTVKNYLFRIFDKLGVSSRVEVVLYALNGSRTLERAPSIVRPKKENSITPLIAKPPAAFRVAMR